MWDLNQLDQFACVDTEDLYFTGTFQTVGSSYLHFELVSCEEPEGYNGTYCADDATVTQYFASHVFVGVSGTTFVNFEDLEDPIRTSLNYLFLDQLSTDQYLKLRKEV